MMSLEGRIARIEITLAMIFKMLPGFIREPLGKQVEEAINDMKKDGLETIRCQRDTH